MAHVSWEPPSITARGKRALRRDARPSDEPVRNGWQAFLEPTGGRDRRGIVRDTQPGMEHPRMEQSSPFLVTTTARERQMILRGSQKTHDQNFATTFGETSQQAVANGSQAEVEKRLEASEQKVNFLEQQMKILQAENEQLWAMHESLLTENERLESEIASLQQKSPRRKTLPSKKTEKAFTFQSLQIPLPPQKIEKVLIFQPL